MTTRVSVPSGEPGSEVDVSGKVPRQKRHACGLHREGAKSPVFLDLPQPGSYGCIVVQRK